MTVKKRRNGFNRKKERNTGKCRNKSENECSEKKEEIIVWKRDKYGKVKINAQMRKRRRCNSDVIDTRLWRHHHPHQNYYHHHHHQNQKISSSYQFQKSGWCWSILPKYEDVIQLHIKMAESLQMDPLQGRPNLKFASLSSYNLMMISSSYHHHLLGNPLGVLFP